MDNLWSDNKPNKFWLCSHDPPTEIWSSAIQNALSILNLPSHIADIETVLSYTLGELQFGSAPWQLSTVMQWYYDFKPLVPRPVVNLLKRINSLRVDGTISLSWPMDERYAQFQWEVLRQILSMSDQNFISFRNFWPEGKEFAFVLTHDVETKEGQAFVRNVADLEDNYGFRSSFNFVPERYPLDKDLMEELRYRGFEIGVHGLKHDGKLYQSKESFLRRAERINFYLEQFEAVGFRSPYMHRHPEWLQALNVEYDLSFFDTDPYEPVPGGCMSIWPFTLGRFIELPYTLCQDSTLFYVLGETTPQIWLEKLKMIERNRGMALLNTHPDYLLDTKIMKMYQEFLEMIAEKDNYWHALPIEVSRWWRRRSDIPVDKKNDEMATMKFSVQGRSVEIIENCA
jgi:hypothetical protein